MKKNQINGFTLVELLAVIVILAIVLVIAVPKVMSIIEDSKKATLESTAKMIASTAEKQKVQNTVLGNTDAITCDSVAKTNRKDYADCNIKFDGNIAKVTIEGAGKFAGFYICGGTKTDSTAQEESCTLRTLTVLLDGGSDNNTKYNAKYGAGSTVTLTEPTKEGYTFVSWTVTGTGAKVEGNKLTMGSENTTVTATWEKVELAADTIAAKVGTGGLVQTYATVDGKQVDAGIRYAGATANVSNQVYFNCQPTDGTNEYGSEDYKYNESCELWRIIGVFEVEDGNGNTDSRIKIVKDTVLAAMAWDTTADGVNYINQWGETTLADDTTPYNGASLKQYLNGEYYNSLTSIAKGQISKAIWYTGAVTKDTASGVYEDERSNATGTGATTVIYTTKWPGIIGLIYASDFGYAGTNCGSYTIYDYCKSDSCGNTSNWLTLSSSYWTISPYASYSYYAWRVRSEGYASADDSVDYLLGVRPAVYLSSNVQIIGGDGSTVPYKLK